MPKTSHLDLETDSKVNFVTKKSPQKHEIPYKKNIETIRKAAIKADRYNKQDIVVIKQFDKAHNSFDSQKKNVNKNEEIISIQYSRSLNSNQNDRSEIISKSCDSNKKFIFSARYNRSLDYGNNHTKRIIEQGTDIVRRSKDLINKNPRQKKFGGMFQRSEPKKIYIYSPAKKTVDPFYSKVINDNTHHHKSKNLTPKPTGKLTPSKIQTPQRKFNSVSSTERKLSDNSFTRKNIQGKSNITNIKKFQTNLSESSPNQNLKMKHIISSETYNLKNSHATAGRINSFAYSRMSNQSAYSKRKVLVTDTNSKVSAFENSLHDVGNNSNDNLLKSEQQTVSTIENGLVKFYNSNENYDQKISENFMNKSNLQGYTEDLSHSTVQNGKQDRSISLTEVGVKRRSPIVNKISNNKNGNYSTTSRNRVSSNPKLTSSPRPRYHKQNKKLGRFVNGTNLSNIYVSDSRANDVQIPDNNLSKRSFISKGSNDTTGSCSILKKFSEKQSNIKSIFKGISSKDNLLVDYTAKDAIRRSNIVFKHTDQSTPSFQNNEINYRMNSHSSDSKYRKNVRLVSSRQLLGNSRLEKSIEENVAFSADQESKDEVDSVEGKKLLDLGKYYMDGVKYYFNNNNLDDPFKQIFYDSFKDLYTAASNAAQ